MTAPDYGIDELRDSISDAASRAPEVSGWSVGAHVDHCCLSMIRICRALGASTPPPPRSRPSMTGAMVLLTGRIPRGHAQSPDAVVPKPDASPPELAELLAESQRMIDGVVRLDPKSWFEHFALGVLDRDNALKFIRIHNYHHLKIIADIVKHAASPF